MDVDEFVSAIYSTMNDCPVWNVVKGMDKGVLEYMQKVEEKEKLAYQCFHYIRAFEYGLNLEEWQHELLNVLLVQRAVEHLNQAKILSLAEAEKFLYDKITYYVEMWQKYNTSEDRQKLMMAVACMLIYQKPYEEYMSREEEIDWSPDLIYGIGMVVSYTETFAQEWYETIGKKYQVVFNNDDAIRHTTYAIHYKELINTWRKIENV